MRIAVHQRILIIRRSVNSIVCLFPLSESFYLDVIFHSSRCFAALLCGKIIHPQPQMLTIYSSPSEWRQNSPMPVRNGEDAIALGSAFQLALFLFLDPLPAFEIYHFSIRATLLHE